MNNNIEINCIFHRPAPFSYGKGHIIKTGFKYDSTSIQVYLKVLGSRAIMETEILSQQQEKFIAKVIEMPEINTLGKRIGDVKTDFLSLNLSDLFYLIYLFISKPDDCDDNDEIQITRDGKTIEASYKDVISCVENIYQSFIH